MHTVTIGVTGVTLSLLCSNVNFFSSDCKAIGTYGMMLSVCPTSTFWIFKNLISVVVDSTDTILNVHIPLMIFTKINFHL